MVGAEADCHSKCSVCGTTLSDGTAHSYTNEVTTEATCTTAGVRTYTCECSYCYTEEIAAYHVKADETASVTTCSRCGEKLVVLNATNFPDATFLTYVEQFDTDGDGMLLGSELTEVTEIDVSGTSSVDGGITSLTGIEHFTELTSLTCDYNSGITSIDISAFEKLTSLHAVNCTGITTLNVANHTTLEYLNICGCTTLGNIDFTGCTRLQTLYVNRGTITELDVSACTALTQIHVESCEQLESLDLSANTNLEIVNARYMTSLQSFNASSCTKITSILLSGDSALQSIDVSGCTALTSLDTSTLTSLTTLTITGSGLESVNLASNLALETFVAENSSLTSLEWTNQGTEASALTTVDVSGSEALTKFMLLGNFASVATIDTSGCTAMTGFEFNTQDDSYTSALTSLNYEGCTAMESITLHVTYGDLPITGVLDFANYPNLKSISLSSVTNITAINLASNTNLTAVSISDSVITELNVSNSTGLEELVLSNCDNLTSIDLSQNKALVAVLIAFCDQITSFELEDYPSLVYVEAMDIPTISLKNVPELIEVRIGFDFVPVTSLTINGSEKMTSLDLKNLRDLETLDLTNCTALTSFDITGCTSLQSLDLNGCTGITSLDMSGYSGLTSLTYLDIQNNGNLKSVDFSTLTALETIDLAMSGNMTDINISNTQLTNFDSTGMYYVETYICQNATKLAQVYLGNAPTLTALDVTGCSSTLQIDLSDSSSLYGSDYAVTITGYESTMNVY